MKRALGYNPTMASPLPLQYATDRQHQRHLPRMREGHFDHAHQTEGRMKHRLLTFLSVISLLLFVATVALWIESEFATDFWYRAERLSQVSISSGAGELSLLFIRIQTPDGPRTPEWRFSHFRGGRSVGSQAMRDVGSPQRMCDRLGFHFLNQAQSPTWGGKMTLLTIPFWLLSLIAVTVPLVRVANKLRRSRLRRQRRCVQCGYDLRAPPYRCPECGNVPEKAVETPA